MNETKQAQHTPGPWVTLERYTNRQAVPVGRRRDSMTHDIFAEAHGHNCEANAQLIAQAPAMIEALQRCKAVAEDSSLSPSAQLELIRDCSASRLPVANS